MSLLSGSHGSAGALWFAIPPINFHAKSIKLLTPRRLVEHDIPGRVGGVIDDMGAPSRRFLISAEWHDSMFIGDPVWSDLAKEGRAVISIIAAIEFAKISRIRIPIASPLIASFVRFENMSVEMTGGKPDRYLIDVTVREDLPYGLSTKRGITHLIMERAAIILRTTLR